jgi:hypothetical protein
MAPTLLLTGRIALLLSLDYGPDYGMTSLPGFEHAGLPVRQAAWLDDHESAGRAQ